MNKRAVIIGKGCSLLDRNLGPDINSFDLVVRVNHMPKEDQILTLGSRTDIYACRYASKLKTCLPLLKNLKIWQCCWEMLIEKDEWPFLKEAQKNGCDIEFMSHYGEFTPESSREYMDLVKEFGELGAPLETKADKAYGFCMPDTGITSLFLALRRLKDYDIYVCGFDLYLNGNKNITNNKSQASIFNTPTLKQILYYKKLILAKQIYEL